MSEKFKCHLCQTEDVDDGVFKCSCCDKYACEYCFITNLQDWKFIKVCCNKKSCENDVKLLKKRKKIKKNKLQ